MQHYTGADSFALNGALVGYGVDYVQLGEATADMVSQLLCDGKTPADLPYQTFDNGIVTINTETAEALGLDLAALKEAFKPYCTEIVRSDHRRELLLNPAQPKPDGFAGSPARESFWRFWGKWFPSPVKMRCEIPVNPSTQKT